MTVEELLRKLKKLNDKQSLVKLNVGNYWDVSAVANEVAFAEAEVIISD